MPKYKVSYYEVKEHHFEEKIIEADSKEDAEIQYFDEYPELQYYVDLAGGGPRTEEVSDEEE